jgi:hypothetical protein
MALALATGFWETEAFGAALDTNLAQADIAAANVQDGAKRAEDARAEREQMREELTAYNLLIVTIYATVRRSAPGCRHGAGARSRA